MSRLDDLDDTTRHLINRHADELTTTATTSLAFHSQTPSKIQFKRHNTPAALFHFISRSIGHYIFALLTAPQTIFYDPVGASFAIVALPVINIALLFTQLIFAIGGLFGLGHAGHWFSQTYGFGMSAVNMLQPHLFDDKEVLQAHIAARSALADPYGLPTDNVIEQLSQDADGVPVPTRFFNLDVSKTFLLLCALVYERDDEFVAEAAKLGKNSTLAPKERRERVANMLMQSTSRIRKQALRWGMRFASISDFTSVGGPFCGLFWPAGAPANGEAPWVVLAFKGTSPTNVSEFLIDGTIAHRPANAFFGGGAVHQGFYTALAPGAEARTDPYATILHALRHLATQLRAPGAPPVPLWVTGHSLGAALASLLYARLLASPGDVGPDLALRQAYTYGAPRSADADFCARFDFAMSVPFGDATRSLWRVIDRWDVVTHIPPGLADREENRAVLPDTSLLNYGHFGIGVQLTGSAAAPVGDDEGGSGFVVQRGSLRDGARVVVVARKPVVPTNGDVAKPDKPTVARAATAQPKTMDLFGYGLDPIAFLRSAIELVGPGADHIPSNYWKRLLLVRPDVEVAADDGRKANGH